MIVNTRNRPQNIPNAIFQNIEREISASLRAVETEPGRFIVNDTLWYKLNADEIASPCVMNAAEFISQKVERTINNRFSWQIQFSSHGQRIDGFKAFPLTGLSYTISEDNYRRMVNRYWQDHSSEEVEMLMREVREHYVVRRKYDIQQWNAEYQGFFSPSSNDGDKFFNVGLEFETGNIASAFRSFTKLQTLYERQIIDLGIFITSKKSDAHRIWPVSNRNVTYEELEKRQYTTITRFPLVEFVFAPDGYSRAAPFLAKDGTTYVPSDTGQIEDHNGERYRVFIRGNAERVLSPIDQSSDQ